MKTSLKFNSRYILLILIIATTCFSCKTNQKKDNLSSFDISGNDENVIFSYYTSNVGASIYEMNIDGSKIKRIISSSKDKNYFDPVYSPNNEKILFFEYDKNNLDNIIICIFTAILQQIYGVGQNQEETVGINASQSGTSAYCEGRCMRNACISTFWCGNIHSGTEMELKWFMAGSRPQAVTASSSSVVFRLSLLSGNILKTCINVRAW